jgi:hypothetical protein
MGSQPIYGKGPRPLLWAGVPAVRGTRTVRGITNFLNYCEIFIEYINYQMWRRAVGWRPMI